MNKLLKLSFILLCLWGFESSAQTIKGVVKDENKEPMIGAAVRVSGTTIGTTTNLDGEYTLTNLTPGNVTLEFSFVGYNKQTREAKVESGKTNTLNVELSTNANLMDELVVVGYGVQRRRDVSGSIVSLEGKDLMEVPTPSFENGLQGKAAGVQVITGSGAAGSASVVRIRGVASVSAGGDPLYVIDGIPITQDYFLNGNNGAMNNNPLAAINPNDIESVEVLKDAAATGIYGSRGSNGVILITTKRGSASKGKGIRVDFSTRQGVSMPTAKPNMMDSQQFLQMFEEAWVNDGRLGVPVLPGNISWADAQKTNTNWVDETVGIGYQQNYDLGISKATDKYNVYGGFSRQSSQSYMIGNSYDRTSGRLNADYKPVKWASIALSSSLSQGVNNRIAQGWSGGLGAAMSTALPIYPIYYENDVLDDDGNVVHKAGDYYFPSNDINRNPVAARELKDLQSKENRTINNLTLTFTPIKDLVITGTGSVDYMFWRNNEYQKTGYDQNNPTFSNAYRQSFDVFNYNTNLRVNYLKSFAEKHNFGFMAGAEYQDSRTNFFPNQSLNQVATGFLDENNPEVINDGNRRFEEWNFLSYFGRINYNFKNKYYLEVNAREDGSSRFGKNNKFGFFPSASVAWILTEESFLKDNRIVSFLKLKSSYGVNGNSNIPPYAQYAFFGQINNAYNGQSIIFPNADNPGNPDLKWETSKTVDFGLEYGFLNDRIHGEIGYYRKQSQDILLNVTTQYSTGFGSAWANVGEILNYGYEFALKAKVIDNKFKWDINFNISRNRNEVTSLGDYTEDAISGGTNDTRLVVGRPIGNNFLVKFSHVDPATGRPVYLDLNGNETFDWSVDNRVSTGTILPDATGAISNTFRYGRFDLTMEWYFVIGGDIYDSSSKRQLGTFDSDGWNHRTDQFDRWRQPGDEAMYPVLTTTPDTYGSGTPWINTDLWLHDASYARLRTLSLGYDLPEAAIRKLKMKSARIIVSANNIFTITKFPGLDPEIARDFENATDRNMSPNITYLTAPQQKSFTLTLNVGF
ncbi:MAG: TonB-dependent receptor [Bacteroidetes bacterium]|nr:TonB-dependent receptor [Bacteroidota bacterium]